MWSLLPRYYWRSWACLYYNPRFNTAFQCGSSFSWGLLRVIICYTSVIAEMKHLKPLTAFQTGLLRWQTQGWSSQSHVTRGVYCGIRRTLQWNSMSKSNKHEQRTSAKHQKPNPLRWETTTVDTAAYGQDTALQQGQIMIDASSSSLYTQSRLYSQEELHNSQMSK